MHICVIRVIAKKLGAVAHRAAALAVSRLAAAIAIVVLMPVMAGAQPIPVPSAHPTSVSYMHQTNLLWALAQLVTLAVPLVLLVSGYGARLRTCCARLAGGRWFWTLALFAAAYLVIAALAMLPVEFVREFLRANTPGHHSAGYGNWFTKQGVNLVVEIVVAALFLWIPFSLIARSPRYWWLYGALALVPVAFLVLVALPVFVDPLTASYRPIVPGPLRDRIEALTQRCHVSDMPILVGGNEDTAVGLGPTRRIFLQSDIATAKTLDQAEFTVAHELKHYLLGDNWKALAIVALFLFAGFWLTNRLGRAAIRRWSARFGFSDLADPASLPLIVFVFAAIWLCALPGFNYFARHIESEADRFGLELSHQNRAVAQLFASWMQKGEEPPDWDRFFTVFRATHPSNAARIRFANEYHPWSEGKAGVYDGVCDPRR